MQINSKSFTWKYPIISSSVVFGIWIISYILGQRSATLTSDFIYIPLTVLLTITAFFQIYQSRKERKEILIWSILGVYAMTYNIAQHIWAFNELILDQKPFPSFADFAFTIGAISLVIFFILIIKVKKQFISKKMLGISAIPGGIVIILSSYFFISNYAGYTLDQIILLGYPILDSIALTASTIGIMLYFKNKLGVGMYLICFSMIPLTIGDILFQITSINETDYSGSVSDLFFYIQIILLIFGIYKISNSKDKTNFSEDQN